MERQYHESVMIGLLCRDIYLIYYCKRRAQSTTMKHIYNWKVNSVKCICKLSSIPKKEIRGTFWLSHCHCNLLFKEHLFPMLPL